MPEQTEGHRRVRLSFNPGGKDPRLTEMAMTAFEESAMWAVKSVTAGE